VCVCARARVCVCVCVWERERVWVCVCVWVYMCVRMHRVVNNNASCVMGWLWLVGSIKLQVSFAKEPYKRDYILQKRPVLLSILMTVATPYRNVDTLQHTSIHYNTLQQNILTGVRAVATCAPLFATRCNTLQQTATDCNRLQHTATEHTCWSSCCCNASSSVFDGAISTWMSVWRD